jgi:secreted trypsin-like serine protease
MPAVAMVGGAPPATGDLARHPLMVVGSRGNFCTGTALARDLVLTAAHCVLPGADYKIVEFGPDRQPRLRDLARIERHPQFNVQTLLAHRATADVALLKTAEPLPAAFLPAPLAGADVPLAVGEHFTVAGAGLTVRGDGATGGTVRTATLVATGRPGNLQLRLVDPAGRGEVAGLGACTGDSGAPVFAEQQGRLAVMGVVSWSTGPKASAGCGGLTGVTPLALYRGWIIDTARRLGSALVPPSGALVP